ncbi:MAG: TaqI-like C-terminal specificity domain-containing protein [Armatimonadota bacterium]
MITSDKPVSKTDLSKYISKCMVCLKRIYESAVPECAGVDPIHLYHYSIRYLLRLIAVLIASENISQKRINYDPVSRAANALLKCLKSESSSNVVDFRVFETSVNTIFHLSKLDIFAPVDELNMTRTRFTEAAEMLVDPVEDSSLVGIFYQSMPLWWFGRIYQSLLDLHPTRDGKSLEKNISKRKNGGVFLTPTGLVRYITQSILTPLLELDGCDVYDDEPLPNSSELTILDPSVGGGDFLINAAQFICTKGTLDGREVCDELKKAVISDCLYGVDIDPISANITKYCLWAASGFADGISQAINSHIVCNNILYDNSYFDWENTFPDVLKREENSGFDAVIGNPPYVASKNGLELYGLSSEISGQSDLYLLFLKTILDKNLVAPGGYFSMVLPDPLLIRENAAEIRKRLIGEWCLESLVHITGVFPGVRVSNVVPICRNTKKEHYKYKVTKITHAQDRHNFAMDPFNTVAKHAIKADIDLVLAQKRYEFLYLLGAESFRAVLERIHGRSLNLSEYNAPFQPLSNFPIKIYRGEEVGKSSIFREHGNLPILLGGQSIKPYEINWEGYKVDRGWIRKKESIYSSAKILVQKSSAKIIAGYDKPTDFHPGYIFPQSVYGICLDENEISPYYLLCILNSDVMNEYIYRTVTGYKLLQPQLEIEDIKALPIPYADTETIKNQSDLSMEYIDLMDKYINFDNQIHFSDIKKKLNALTDNHIGVYYSILDHLGRKYLQFLETHKDCPDSENTTKLENTKSLIEGVVGRIYSSNL